MRSEVRGIEISIYETQENKLAEDTGPFSMAKTRVDL